MFKKVIDDVEFWSHEDEAKAYRRRLDKTIALFLGTFIVGLIIGILISL